MAKQVGSIAYSCWAQIQSVTSCHAQETMQVLKSAQANLPPQAACPILFNLDATCRWHIEGEITHDWKKLAERKEKQLRKLSDIYKGQLDKVINQSINLHFSSLGVIRGSNRLLSRTT